MISARRSEVTGSEIRCQILPNQVLKESGSRPFAWEASKGGVPLQNGDLGLMKFHSSGPSENAGNP